jgi:predicted DNA repair protein MutK
VAITIGVYGVVALIVKMDDIGLHLSKRPSAIAKRVGAFLVQAMPVLLQALSHIGVAAMVWVGGGILLHGLTAFGLNAIPDFVHHLAEDAAHAVPFAGGFVEWLVGAIGSGIVGLIVGGVIVGVIHLIPRKKAAAH